MQPVNTLTRRHLLEAGSAGFLGLNLPQLLRASSGKKRRAKSIIGQPFPISKGKEIQEAIA